MEVQSTHRAQGTGLSSKKPNLERRGAEKNRGGGGGGGAGGDEGGGGRARGENRTIKKSVVESKKVTLLRVLGLPYKISGKMADFVKGKRISRDETPPTRAHRRSSDI